MKRNDISNNMNVKSRKIHWGLCFLGGFFIISTTFFSSNALLKYSRLPCIKSISQLGLPSSIIGWVGVILMLYVNYYLKTNRLKVNTKTYIQGIFPEIKDNEISRSSTDTSGLLSSLHLEKQYSYEIKGVCPQNKQSLTTTDDDSISGKSDSDEYSCHFQMD